MTFTDGTAACGYAEKSMLLVGELGMLADAAAAVLDKMMKGEGGAARAPLDRSEKIADARFKALVAWILVL